MKITTRLCRWAGLGACAAGFSPLALAQGGAFGGGFGPPLEVQKPPREFASSEEHYQYLLEQANGGTKHTLATVPRWDGLWQPAGNTSDGYVANWWKSAPTSVPAPATTKPRKNGRHGPISSASTNLRGPDR